MAMANNIDEYRRKLRVSKHAIDDALEEQADILDRIGQEVTRSAAALAAAEDRLKTTEARLTLGAKDGRGDDEKLTVPQIAAKVRTDAGRRSDWQEVQRCVQEHADWQKLYRSWEERSYSLKGLGGLHASGYFTASSHTMPRAAGPDDRGRGAIRQASDERREERAAREALQSARDAGIDPARVTRRALT